MAKKRIEWIDIAKGICIILVILGHELTWNDILRFFIYSFHIPCFFFLGGMTMKITDETSLKYDMFYQKNVSGLLRPYILISMLYILIDLFYTMVSIKDVRVVFVDIIQMFCGYGINVCWFLISLFVAKNIFYFAIKKITPFCLIFSEILLAILIIGISLQCEGISENGYIEKAIYYVFIGISRPFIVLPFVSLGYFLYERLSLAYSTLVHVGSVLLLILGGGGSSLFHWKVTLVNNFSKPFFAVFVVGLLGSIGIIGVSKMISRLKFIKFAFSFWGRNSLFIMLTHEYVPIRSTIQNWCESTFPVRYMNIMVTLVLTVLIETGGIVLWNTYLKKWYISLLQNKKPVK